MVRGEAAISPLLATKIMEEFARQGTRKADTSPSDSELTERETDVLTLVAGGALNKQIAATLNITDNTVKYHMRNIMEKLHLRNRAQMAAYAISKGITPQSLPEN